VQRVVYSTASAALDSSLMLRQRLICLLTRRKRAQLSTKHQERSAKHLKKKNTKVNFLQLSTVISCSLDTEQYHHNDFTICEKKKKPERASKSVQRLFPSAVEKSRKHEDLWRCTHQKTSSNILVAKYEKKTVTPPSLLLDSKPATTRDTAEAKKKQYI
jgi:hypothetical protein